MPWRRVHATTATAGGGSRWQRVRSTTAMAGEVRRWQQPAPRQQWKRRCSGEGNCGGGNRGDGGGDNGDDGDDDDDDDGGGSDADDDGGDNDDDVSNDDHNGGNGGGGCYTATAAGTDTDKSTINQKWQLTTGADGPEVAVEAMASGAHGFHVTCM